MKNHIKECLKTGDESNCPVCKPINERLSYTPN